MCIRFVSAATAYMSNVYDLMGKYNSSSSACLTSDSYNLFAANTMNETVLKIESLAHISSNYSAKSMEVAGYESNVQDMRTAMNMSAIYVLPEKAKNLLRYLRTGDLHRKAHISLILAEQDVFQNHFGGSCLK